MTKNQTKIHKNRYQRLTERFGLKMSIFKKFRQRFRKCLGCVLGRPRNVLEGFRTSLGASLGVLGRLGGVLDLIF